MRIRIVRTLPIRDVDGIALDTFEVGQEYDVGSRLGALFLAEGWAEPAVAGLGVARARRAKRSVASDKPLKTSRTRR
jgi:hypothetical protein